MQRPNLLGMVLMTGSCLVIATVASAEPVSQPPAKKHAECEGSKVKTACNKQADIKDFVTSRQAPSTSAPATAEAPQTAASKSQQDVQSVDESAGPQPK